LRGGGLRGRRGKTAAERFAACSAGGFGMTLMGWTTASTPREA